MQKFLIVLLFSFLIKQVCAQGWEHTYLNSESISYVSRGIIEDYDKGFLIVTYEANLDVNNDVVIRMKLIKTDINGNIIWQKQIGVFEDIILGDPIISLSNGSIIIGGSEKFYGNSESSFILKLNKCRELEWIKALGKTDYDYVNNLIALSDGNILVHARYVGEARISLYKINEKGKILWKKDFFKDSGTDPEIGFYTSVTARSILETEDKGLILSGIIYTYLPSDSNLVASRTFVLKTDEFGEREWLYVYGKESDTLITQSAYIIEQKNGYTVHCTYRYHQGDTIARPHLFKLDKQGNLLWGKHIGNTIYNSHSKGIVEINDTLYLISDMEVGDLVGEPDVITSFYIKVLKTDTLGNILAEKDFGKDSMYMTSAQAYQLTEDNTILIAGYQDSINYRAYALQIDKDLNIVPYKDTILEYDYLCDHEIEDSFIAFDTALSIINIAGKKYEIISYPNPAIEYINFEINELENFTYTLRIYDFRGRQILEEKNITEKVKKLNTTALNKSVYFYQLDFGNGNMVSSSFIKE